MSEVKNTEHYAVHLLEPDWVLDDEAMGSKEKNWFLLPDSGDRWLFKAARTNNGVPTGEHWAEKIAAEIAGLLGIEHADVDLAEIINRVPDVVMSDRAKRFALALVTATKRKLVELL